MPDLTLIATVTIFIATYAVVAVGKVPVYRIDRAGAALLGGSLIIAMAATFAGNFTLVGSVANLIVAQRAKARGVEIGFWAISRSAHH
jgi:Na+/H+ antiporter NhaD/arsenite permease-like protein